MVESARTKPFRFDSENLLQQAIAGLLARMPNVTGVQILQGSQEYGKDIVFYVPGGLNERLLCASVIKTTKISGKVMSSSVARTVLLQAAQALDTLHVVGNGQEEYVRLVYVITPYPIEPAAISAIQGALKEKRGQVTFIGGPTLFEPMTKYRPAFAADEADAISLYFADARSALEPKQPIFRMAAIYQPSDNCKSQMSVI